MSCGSNDAKERFANWNIGDVGVVDDRSGSKRVGEMGGRGCRRNGDSRERELRGWSKGLVGVGKISR